ncbi:MAG: ATP-dependent Clp protease adapter ClpS [Verrucomicrobiales bacterium]|jgi:ATP-dependent Clp protease adaptor protein ClpS|nr:ATP-dependent Clp protease adapter ClpS [Verrucomicrobiales bacterium]|tara:strand:- start:4035 stop:4328 length:294 start_codon:yes stop_codon:yes gene_type:complete
MSSDIDEITITEIKTETDLESTWNVIVYDDPVNLMSFVTLIIQRVFGYPKEKAQSLMLEVHQDGQSVVWTGIREQAELYVQQLQGHHLLAAMKRVTD